MEKTFRCKEKRGGETQGGGGGEREEEANSRGVQTVLCQEVLGGGGAGARWGQRGCGRVQV